MAKKDVLNYYLDVQNQYIEMLEISLELNKLLKQGVIEQDDERLINIENEVNLIKNNYDRIAYILFLLNQPARKEKKKVEYKQNKQFYDYLESSSKDTIIKEDTDALKYLKKTIKELKDGH